MNKNNKIESSIVIRSDKINVQKYFAAAGHGKNTSQCKYLISAV